MTSRIPFAYQEVEYIESSGTQYIDTGLKPDNSYSVKMRVQNGSPDGSYCLFGVDSDWMSKGFALHVATGEWGSAELKHTSLGTTATHDIEFKNATVYMDGASVGSVSNSSFVCDYSMSLFALNRNGTAREHCTMKLYHCQIYDDEVLVRDYIPCYRKSDNAIGLYDAVNDTLFVNNGSGTFGIGAEVNFVDRKFQPGIVGKTNIVEGAVIPIGEKRPANTTLLMHFDENLEDKTGLNTPTLSSGTEAYVVGRFKNAIRFDGSNCIKIPYGENVVFGSGNFTIAGWFYLPSGQPAYAHLLSHSYRYGSSYTFSGLHLNFYNQTRTLGMRIYTSYSAAVFVESTTTEIPTDEWVHIALVRSGTTVTLYINGIKETSMTISGSVYQHSSSSFKIGSATNESASNDNPHQMLANGSMVDEFIIVKEALWTEDFEPPTRAYA